MRNLIAEDDAISRRVLERTLTKWGYEVVSTRDGAEAWAILKSEDTPSIAILDWEIPEIDVILDYLLPQMDGETLARTIKADPELEETVLVMFTSAAKKVDAKRFKEAGFTAFLTKPIRQSILMDTLATVWAKKVQGNSTELITSHSVIEARAVRADVKNQASKFTSGSHGRG